GAGVLGAAPQPQAHTAFPPSQMSQQAPAWDQTALISALNQLAYQNQGSWVMDFGTSSHMSSTDGLLITGIRQAMDHVYLRHLPSMCFARSITTPRQPGCPVTRQHHTSPSKFKTR
ncbi:unnamed protein product, partial [Urochloa humidicola]